MALPSPQLDDRDFDELLEEARRLVTRRCPKWTDLSPGDPGMTLIEAFAHLTEVTLYRLNRLPDKAYVAFLRLLGVSRRPPSAAEARLRFTRSGGTSGPVEIPRGTRVTLSRSGGEGEPPVFATAARATLEAEQDRVEVLAHHCETVEAELAGEGTGLPGQSVTAERAPIVAPTGHERDLAVAVEADEEELPEAARAVRVDGRTYRVWEEVEEFGRPGQADHVYTADRMEGVVRFAPAVRRVEGGDELSDTPETLAAVPGDGREIRLWYRAGGGPEGNVAAETLTVLKDAVPGVEVTNPEKATGGREAESVENALERGPRSLHSLRRTVTARDYEAAAIQKSGAVARAKAFTKAEKWAHARPGTVQVLLVPHVSDGDGRGRVTPEDLAKHRSERDRKRIEEVLAERRPLGTETQVDWAHVKPVRIRATVVVFREEDPSAVERRIRERLHAALNPLPGEERAGWTFGRPLRISQVYELLLSEPGVSYVEDVILEVDEAPSSHVAAVAADRFQEETWYAAAGDELYRTTNAGEGWERSAVFPDEAIVGVEPSPHDPGHLAVATLRSGDEKPSSVHLSRDCGETWFRSVDVGFQVRDLAWTEREEQPEVLMATRVGLYRLGLGPDATPIQSLLVEDEEELGLYAVASAVGVRGDRYVATAAEEQKGVYLSVEGGRSGSFRQSGLSGRDVRVLEVQRVGPVRYLWAGEAAAGGDPGRGCSRLRLSAGDEGGAQEEWKSFSEQWEGGSCLSLAFPGDRAVAGSHRAGVLRLDTSVRSPKWTASSVDCGLPLRDPGRLHPVEAVASDPGGSHVMAAGTEGVFRSDDDGETFRDVSRRSHEGRVTVPDTWLLCSGEHAISVVPEDRA